MKKKSKCLLIIVSMFLLFSCSTLNNKSWESLTDRNFYFSRFLFYRKGDNRADVFKCMKDFPVNKLLKIISHKYNINVDSSEFNDFIIMEDDSKMKVTGVLGNSNFTWEMSEKKENLVEIEYWNKYIPEESYELREYKVIIRVKGKKRAQFFGKFYDTIPELVTTAKNMDYERVDKDSDNYYINTGNNSKVDLTTVEKDMAVQVSKKEKLIKPDIKKLIKEFINDLPKENRKEFRDDLIKFLYTIIE